MLIFGKIIWLSISFDEFELGDLNEKNSVATWNFVVISAFSIKQR
jgi:hypothetical protein